MNSILTKIIKFGSITNRQIVPNVQLTSTQICFPQQQRWLSLSSRRLQESVSEAESGEGEKEKYVRKVLVVDVETSKKYMKSKAFELAYGGVRVWEPYRRNFKGRRPPTITRRTCIRGEVYGTGNPCPICRDEYLVLDHTHTELLHHFISAFTGEVEHHSRTGLCQMQHKRLLIAVHKAWDLGYIKKSLPPKTYDYSTYYPQLREKKMKSKQDNIESEASQSS